MRAVSGRVASCRAISLPRPTLAPVINTVFSAVVCLWVLGSLGTDEERRLDVGLERKQVRGRLGCGEEQTPAADSRLLGASGTLLRATDAGGNRRIPETEGAGMSLRRRTIPMAWGGS